MNHFCACVGDIFSEATIALSMEFDNKKIIVFVISHISADVQFTLCKRES